MAPTRTLDIERLDDAAVPAMLALSAEAGWNQTEADWRIFLAQGQVFAIRAGDRLAATATILPYGAFAWISMVLVTASRRQQGLGTQLLRHCIAELKKLGCIPYLDATAAGEKVYLPLGFQPITGIARWQGQGGGERTLTAASADLDACLARDTAAFGARRDPLLRSFLGRMPGLAIQTDRGFVAARNGRLATQIGPLAADSEADARSLMNMALDRADGPVFLDVPERWASLGKELERRGFTIQRGFRRMALGSTACNGDPARSFVIAGPEFG